VGEDLKQLIEASLLQPFDIVFDRRLQWQLVLIEVKLVARCDHN